MKAQNCFVTSRNAFSTATSLLNAVFRTPERLPRQVFQPGFGFFAWTQFEWALSADFWSELTSLARQSGDDAVFTAVLDPHPDSYYHELFGFYAVLQLPVRASELDYWNALSVEPPGSPADALAFNSNVVTWFSPSGTWGIWGERALGVCVAAFKEVKMAKATAHPESWHSLEDAIQKIIAPNFGDEGPPRSFLTDFWTGYSNSPSS